MFSGMIAVIIKGIIDVGGLGEVWRINQENGRLNFFEFDPNPLIRQSFWSLFIGGIFAWSMSYCIDQQMVQRFLAAKTKKTAQTALLLNIPGVFLLISICCFSGLVVYANFDGCDPLSAKQGIKNPNQLLPYFVLRKFNEIPFLPGIFLSSIFCASLSSVSSALNSMSACIWRDYLMRLSRFKDFDDNQSAKTTKVIVLICGAICTGMSFLIATLGSNLIQISSTINGSLQAPIIGIFFLSSMFSFVNIAGLFSGALSGFVIGCWLALGSFIVKPAYEKLPVSIANCSTPTNSTVDELIFRNGVATNLQGFNKIYSVSYMWLSPIGVLTTVVIGVIVSLLTNRYFKRTKKLDDSLILFPKFRLFKDF
jgi:Na+/proline symporter